MTIDQQIAAVITREGGYVNALADRGGPTNFGITQAVARANGFSTDMRTMTRANATAIYAKAYWQAPHLDLVAALAPKTAAEMFDTSVNCGTATAIMMLQRALNVMQATELKVDGVLTPGGATLTTLGSYMDKRRADDGDAVLAATLNALQGERYVELAERSPSQRAFLFGWIKNRVEMSL